MAPNDHRIPRVYKEGAKVLKEVLESKRGLKDIIYSNRNKMLHRKLIVLLDRYLDNQNSINKFIEETSLSENVKNEFVVKILCTELLYGRKCLPCIENNTMNNVTKAYELYCQENNISDSNTSIFDDKTSNCDSQNSINQFIVAKKKLRYIRVNTLMTSVDDIVVQLVNDGFVELPKANSYDEYLSIIEEYTGRYEIDEEYFMPDYHLNDVFVFLQSTNFHNYGPYMNGSIFLQDKASCFPTHLLSPPPNSVVFDTCAAPGNKTLHLAAYMQNQGKVYAVDKDPKRFKYMTEVVELAQGSEVVQTILSDIFDVRMADYTDVEYVLVDPSCSGTGITERAKIDNNRQMSAGRIKNLAGFQKDLLGRVCSYFPNVKRIVYCTCSVQEEENEQVVEDIMAKYGNRFQVEDLTRHPTLVGWKHFGNEKYTHGKKCFYALPSDYCTGFFAAVFNRIDSNRAAQVDKRDADIDMDEEECNRKRSRDESAEERTESESWNNYALESEINHEGRKKKKRKHKDDGSEQNHTQE